MNYWYIKDDFVRARTNQSTWYDGFSPDAMGDGALHTVSVGLVKNMDNLITRTIWLLRERKRWPDSAMQGNEHHIAKNRLDKLLHPKKYRWQHRMSRDPFTALIFVMEVKGCVWSSRIKDIKIPWRIQRPDFYYWVRFMATKEPKYKKRYEFWTNISLTLFGRWYPMYALRLQTWKAYSAKSEKIKKKLHKLIPDWNMYCCILIDKPCIYKPGFIEKAQKYIAKTKCQWSYKEWITPTMFYSTGKYFDLGYWDDDIEFTKGNVLREEDEIKLDKDELDWALKTVMNVGG